MDVDLQLDPQNPPRYCPQCARSGLKSKVKKFRIDTTSTEMVIMCKNEKCPWPFSVQSRSEATVDSSVDSSTSKSYSRKKKVDKESLCIHVPTTEVTVTASPFENSSKNDNIIAPQPLSNNIKTDDNNHKENGSIATVTNDGWVDGLNVWSNNENIHLAGPATDNVETVEELNEEVPVTVDDNFLSTPSSNRLEQVPTSDQMQINEITVEARGDEIDSRSDELYPPHPPLDPVSLHDNSVSAASSSFAEPSKQLPELFDATSKKKMTMPTTPDEARRSCFNLCNNTSLAEYPTDHQTEVCLQDPTELSNPKQDHSYRDLADRIPHLSRSEPDKLPAGSHCQDKKNVLSSSLTTTYTDSVSDIDSLPAAHSTPKLVRNFSAMSSSSKLGSSIVPSTPNYSLSSSARGKSSPVHPHPIEGSFSLGQAVVVEHGQEELAFDAVKVQNGGFIHDACKEHVSQCEDDESSTSTPPKHGIYPTAHTNLTSSLMILPPPNQNLSSSVTSSSICQALVVEFERAEFAAAAVQLQGAGLNSTTIKKYQPGTRMARKRKANVCESSPELKHKRISDANNLKEQKRISNSEGGEVPNHSDKGNESILPPSVHKNDDLLTEQKRIQSLIKPPYPRRRRIGAGSPRIQSTSTTRSPRSRQTIIKAKLPTSKGRTSTKCLLRKRKTSVINEDACKTHKITHTFAKDLVLKVTKVLEAQSREGEKVNETDIDTTSNLGGKQGSDENVGSEVHVEESIQVLMPKKTYRRIKRFKPRLQQSPVPEVTDNNITLEESSPCSHCVVNFCVGSSPSIGDPLVGGEVLDKAVNNIGQKCPDSVSGYGYNKAPVDQDNNHDCAHMLDLRNNSGDISSFMWMGWNINEKFLTSYSTYLRKLVNKWAQKENGDLDPRIFALLKERENHKNNPKKFDKVISFFSEVFVKFIYLKSKLSIFNLGRMFKILKQTYVLENKLFKSLLIDEEVQTSTTCNDNHISTRQNHIFKSASNPPFKSKPPQAHGLVPDVPKCSIDPVNFSINSKNSPVPPTLLPLSMESCTTKPVEFEDHVDLPYSHNEEDRDENSVTYCKDGENRGLKGTVLCEGIMTQSAVRNHDKRSLSFSNTCEREALKGMKKKRSGIEEIMGELKKRSTRKSTNICRKTKADETILNKLLDTSKNKSFNLRGQNDGASKSVNSVNRRKSSAPTLFEADAVEEPKLKPVSTMVDNEKTATQGYSGTGFRICSKPSTDTTACTSDGLHNFPQAYARKKQTEKIKRFMDRQKKKAQEGTERKYAGFGEQILPLQKESNKKRKKIDQDIAKKKPKVSKSELDLIEELLNIADSAVAESKSAEVVDDLDIPNNATTEVAPVNNSSPELEEIQTNERIGGMVDDLSSLFEL